MAVNQEASKSYILISSDNEDFEGRKVSAYDIARRRLESRVWPLYPRTKNKAQIRADDVCLIYLAGQNENAQSFIATTYVEEVVDASSTEFPAEKDLLSDPPDKVIVFSRVERFPPVSIRDLLDDLSFINRQGRSWGSSLQGGCRSISAADLSKVLKAIEHG